MCGVLEVSENGYFNWRKRGICQRKQDDVQLTERIEDAFHDNRGVYGSPRIHAELKDQGIQCGRKRIVRLMQEQHIMAKRKRRNARKTESTHPFPLAPNILQRDFTADAPNQKWMTDMTSGFQANHSVAHLERDNLSLPQALFETCYDPALAPNTFFLSNR